MVKILAIMTGGGLGAVARYGLFILAQRLGQASFPTGTLAANLLGSLAIGFLWCGFEGSRLTNEWRLFIFTGFLGGFTTFSTFTRETTQLFKVGEWENGLLYVAASNIAGIALVFAGYWLASRVLHFNFCDYHRVSAKIVEPGTLSVPGVMAQCLQILIQNGGTPCRRIRFSSRKV